METEDKRRGRPRSQRELTATTVYIFRDQSDRVRDVAALEGRSAAAIIREALDLYLHGTAAPEPGRRSAMHPAG